MTKENMPVRELRRWRKGDTLKGTYLNEGVDAINRIIGGVKPPQQISAGGRPSASGPGSSTKIQQFTISGVYSDYLVCNPYDGSVDTTQTVIIAKPYLLRQTPFDGGSRNGVSYTYTTSVSRSATDGSAVETQSVTPSYIGGDIIYAVRNIAGKTATYNAQVEIIEWLDINADGRAWAKEAT